MVTKSTIPRTRDIRGRRFFRLVVINPVGTKKGRRLWQCCCDCGKLAIVQTTRLVSGNTKSCGCWKVESRFLRTKHGNSGREEYSVWMSMRTRCSNPRSKSFKNYGGRGITICNRWNDFALFLDDVGSRPSPKHTLDRINNNGNYEPGNVRWAPRKIQARNARNNVVLEYNGKKRCVAEWAEIIGMSASTLYDRLRRGWSIKKAITQPIKKHEDYGRQKAGLQ